MEIQIPQILFQIVNFGVVFGALTYLLYKPILKILEDRAERIEQGQKAAEKSIANEREMDQVRAKIKQEAQKEASLILEEAKMTAEKNAQEIIAKARTQAQAEMEKMKVEWSKEKLQHIGDMKKEFVSAVVATTEKVLGASVDAKKHDQLIKEELDALLKAL